MVRSILAKALPFVLALSCASFAQTVHTFTHGPLTYGGNAAIFTTLDGEPPNPAIGFSGSIQVPGQFNSYWGLECPQEWGFPNGCFLTNNEVAPPAPGPIVFATQPCQTAYDQYGIGLQTLGCVSTSTTTVPLSGYGSGVTIDVTESYQVTRRLACGHGHCTYIYNNSSTGGAGSTWYTP